MIALEILSYGELDKLFGGSFEEFSTLDNFNRTGFILGCENWDRYDFKALLKLVKSFVLLVWDTRKNKLCGDQDGSYNPWLLLLLSSDWRSYELHLCL